MAIVDVMPSTESPLTVMSTKEAEELANYAAKLKLVASDVPPSSRAGHGMSIASENNLDRVVENEHEAPAPSEKVLRLYKVINELTLNELRNELKEVNLSPHGTRDKLRARLRGYYRRPFSEIAMKKKADNAHSKTRKHFRYLVAVDIEATCEEYDNDVNYPHETIELPAVLIDVENLIIIDKFRTFVRPEINPKLADFCKSLCHISQADVDSAPIFPEAWEQLMSWMENHGLVGGKEDASWAFVTDGPHDVQHFLQRSFLQYHMNIPHEIRNFVNVKKIFNEKICKLNMERRPDEERRTAIEMMCHKLNLSYDPSTKHQGIADAVNVARIAIALVRGCHVPLYINQRIVRRPGAAAVLPPLMNPDELAKALDEWSRKGKGFMQNNIACNRLPYAMEYVTQEQLHSGSYWECPSCDED